MAEQRVQRRPAAILAADVVGHSRLTEADEAATRGRLNSHQRDLIEPRIAGDGGRIVQTTGDGLLAEFPSAIESVLSALAIQASLNTGNGVLPKDQRLVYRVGIHLEDVIIEGNDIHANGVKVAARLESLCEPGDVYVSASDFEQVSGKLDATFEDLGKQAVKNFSRPIRVNRVGTGEDRPARPAEGAAPPPTTVRLSIAVLPFQNMSGDVEREYCSYDISEDIITAVSNIRQLTVIARNTTFTYKGKAVDV